MNLYQFAEKALAESLPLEKAIEFIDIGGPTMLRAAAKNYVYTAPVVDPSDYPLVLEEIRSKGQLQTATKAKLAGKTFAMISKYDSMIAAYFEQLDTPAQKTLDYKQVQTLRYGENPHQSAGFYTTEGHDSGLQDAKVLQGKELSYNNYLDIDAATAIVRDFQDRAAVAIIKHTNPCGVAAHKDDSVVELYQRALSCDSKSAFGGIIACNREIDAEAAKAMTEIFLECIAAPSFSKEAIEVFSAKKNLRLLQVPFLKTMTKPSGYQIKTIQGGALFQTPDTVIPIAKEWQVVTKSQPSQDLEDDLVFAGIVGKHVKSNAIVFVKDSQTVAIGAGQMSRIDAAEIAIKKAKDMGLSVEGSAMASDAFFPFRDTVDFAAKVGVRGIIQPGGSIRDQDSIDACNEQSISMVFTGHRHFKH